MNRWLIENMSWSLSAEEAASILHVNEDDFEEFEDVYNAVMPLISPKIYFGRESIIENDGRNVLIGNTWFHSRILGVNLENIKEVYPYIITSGLEAYKHSESYDDDLYKYWSHQICEIALKRATGAGFEDVKQILSKDNLAAMNPGSLSAWQISQQKPLFELLGDVYEKTGVSLTPTFLMIPIKSGSGIWFETKTHYANCMMCPRSDCRNRRAEFDPNMFKEKYGD
ncbi:MAG: hypothetical protein IJD86_13530 [Clostridia bacterium]|nr:hypothetical protein [Clostridia bacterium]